jgi:hypothetical protein
VFESGFQFAREFVVGRGRGRREGGRRGGWHTHTHTRAAASPPAALGAARHNESPAAREAARSRARPAAPGGRQTTRGWVTTTRGWVKTTGGQAGRRGRYHGRGGDLRRLPPHHVDRRGGEAVARAAAAGRGGAHEATRVQHLVRGHDVRPSPDELVGKNRRDTGGPQSHQPTRRPALRPATSHPAGSTRALGRNGWEGAAVRVAEHGDEPALATSRRTSRPLPPPRLRHHTARRSASPWSPPPHPRRRGRAAAPPRARAGGAAAARAREAVPAAPWRRRWPSERRWGWGAAPGACASSPPLPAAPCRWPRWAAGAQPSPGLPRAAGAPPVQRAGRRPRWRRPRRPRRQTAAAAAVRPCARRRAAAPRSRPRAPTRGASRRPAPAPRHEAAAGPRPGRAAARRWPTPPEGPRRPNTSARCGAAHPRGGAASEPCEWYVTEWVWDATKTHQQLLLVALPLTHQCIAVRQLAWVVRGIDALHPVTHGRENDALADAPRGRGAAALGCPPVRRSTSRRGGTHRDHGRAASAAAMTAAAAAATATAR